MILAPMEDVTDTVFRQIVASVGKPDVMFTEFTNVEGIAHFCHSEPACRQAGVSEESRKAGSFVVTQDDMISNGILQRLVFSEIERPIVAQIWGVDPEKFKIAAEFVSKLGFDGIDINLGCPERKVVKVGACGGMIGQNTQTAEIISATKEGAGNLPVSVKTRIGNKKIITEEWIGFLLEQNLAAITVHGRTVSEQSLVPAHWDEIGKAVKLRDQICKETVLIGNGDVVSLSDARLKAQEFGVDGIMVGRGIFHNPWIFADRTGSQEERIELLKKHLTLWEKTWGEKKNFAVMKKFVKMYVRDFDGASDLRVKLMECKTAEEMFGLL